MIETKRYAKIFKALSNENRLELYLQIVQKHEACFEAGCGCFVTEIKESLSIGAPTISHHLKELSNAELIFIGKKGKYLVCTINEDLISEVSNLFNLKNS